MVKLIAQKETEDAHALLSPWSIPHFFVGMAAKERGIPFWWFELGHALYELKDQIDMHNGGIRNSLMNSIGDQVIATLGHAVATTNRNSYVWTTMYVASWLAALSMGDHIG